MFSKIKIIYVNEISSTQDKVIEYLRNDYYSSLLLVASTQTKGRGRKQDDWFSPKGGFWATLGVKTTLSLNKSQLALFHYFTATLIRRVIELEYDLFVQIKWPNDLIYRNKKLAGILIDYVVSAQYNYILIGIGVNLNNSSNDMPDNLREIAISIKDILKKTVSIENFTQRLCNYAKVYYSPITEYVETEVDKLIQEYNQNSQIFEKDVIINDLGKFQCKGINSEGLMQFIGKKFNLNLSIDDLQRIKRIIS
ncbi:MAG: biotin--[acetyl-CoA-carboxylase] ligase [Promethearchaeota archaeon]